MYEFSIKYTFWFNYKLQEPLTSTLSISRGKHSFELTEISDGKPRMPYLNSMLRAKINRVPRTNRTSIKRFTLSEKMRSKRHGLRRMRKQLGEILTVIANCQTLKIHNSKRNCQDKMKKYILKFMKRASANRFKYIF